jgi:hypothetical protein
LLIFDSYRSHITKAFIDYCWQYCIRLFQLLPHSTHLIQPLDVGVFQKFKHEFKKCIREEVFLGANEITKTDFFHYFNTFSSYTFTLQLCKAAFQKTGLIPLNPNLVLDKMKQYGRVQEVQRDKEEEEESEGFATPPLHL